MPSDVTGGSAADPVRGTVLSSLALAPGSSLNTGDSTSWILFRLSSEIRDKAPSFCNLPGENSVIIGKLEREVLLLTNEYINTYLDTLVLTWGTKKKKIEKIKWRIQSIIWEIQARKTQLLRERRRLRPELSHPKPTKRRGLALMAQVIIL